MKKLISLTVVIILIILAHCRFAMADRVAICTNHAKKRIITLDYLVDGSQLPCQVVYENRRKSLAIVKSYGVPKIRQVIVSEKWMLLFKS